MSNPLNGADARPFNSSNFVSPYAAETYPLASVLNALASNDPEHVVRASADFHASLYQVSALMGVVAEALRSGPEGAFATQDDLVEACGALSGLTALHADMSLQIEAARSALRSSR